MNVDKARLVILKDKIKREKEAMQKIQEILDELKVDLKVITVLDENRLVSRIEIVSIN